MGGVGRLQEVCPQAIVNEIEHEWAAQCPGSTVVADAQHLPFASESFDAVATSPAYGNRMADHHDPKDSSKRISYKFQLGRDLHPNNTGQLHVGEKYWDFHYRIWRECYRVLKPGGFMFLNVSDHIRKGRVQAVPEKHLMMLLLRGFRIGPEHIQKWAFTIPRMRYGANSGARVPQEYLYRLVK